MTKRTINNISVILACIGVIFFSIVFLIFIPVGMFGFIQNSSDGNGARLRCTNANSSAGLA